MALEVKVGATLMKELPETEVRKFAFIPLMFDRDTDDIKDEIISAFNEFKNSLNQIEGFKSARLEMATGLEKMPWVLDSIIKNQRRKRDLRRGGEGKNEKELAKAIGDCKPYFESFLKPDVDIRTPRKKTVPVNKRGVTHFIDYCIASELGYGKAMLRKVYGELKN